MHPRFAQSAPTRARLRGSQTSNHATTSLTLSRCISCTPHGSSCTCTCTSTAAGRLSPLPMHDMQDPSSACVFRVNVWGGGRVEHKRRTGLSSRSHPSQPHESVVSAREYQAPWQRRRFGRHAVDRASTKPTLFFTCGYFSPPKCYNSVRLITAITATHTTLSPHCLSFRPQATKAQPRFLLRF